MIIIMPTLSAIFSITEFCSVAAEKAAAFFIMNRIFLDKTYSLYDIIYIGFLYICWANSDGGCL